MHEAQSRALALWIKCDTESDISDVDKKISCHRGLRHALSAEIF